MNALANSNDTTPSVGVKLLVDQHGIWAVLRAVMALLLKPSSEVVQVDHLSPHMLRDLGLLPIEQPRRYWELR